MTGVLLAPGVGPSIAELANVAVRRISAGHLVAATACATVRDVTRALLAGDGALLMNSIPQADMQGLADGDK